MAKRFVSLWFPYLTTDWHARKQPQLRQVAFVLKAPSHNRVVITAISPLAQAQGIHTGMVLADARALYPSLLALDDKPGLSSQLLDRIAEWCIRFTPLAAPDPPSSILLDASGCTHLWGGEELFLTDIHKRISIRGYAVRLALADTIGAAWALARYGHNQKVIEPGGQLHALLPLSVASLRLNEETLVRLHKLGLRQVKDIVGIPRTALRRRFGAELLQRFRQALGEDEEHFTPVYPLEAFQERLPCLEPIVTREGIEIALLRLLKTLCTRLRGKGKGLRSAFFRGYRIDGGVQGIEIGTNRPSCKEEHLFQLFSLKLSTLEPAAGFELFLLEATTVEDLGAVQEELCKGSGGFSDPALGELLDRLAVRLGKNSIQHYLPSEHYWPERSFQQASGLNNLPFAEWRLDRPRPLQLLSPPEPVEVTAPIPDYPPMLFRYKGQLHKIVKADGPERIEQEWWVGEGEHRDYYCVEDEEGGRYWLFRSGHYTAEKREQWYLHGFFA